MSNEVSRRSALGAAGATIATLAVGSIATAADEAEKLAGVKLFEKVDASMVTRGAPPLVFHPTPDSHIVFKTQEELKAWEDEVRTRLGVRIRTELGSSSESCSAGCSDDCD